MLYDRREGKKTCALQTFYNELMKLGSEAPGISSYRSYLDAV